MAAKKRSKKVVFMSVKHFNVVSRRPDSLRVLLLSVILPVEHVLHMLQQEAVKD
jgi:hypothetical protein